MSNYRDSLPKTREVARESGRWGLWALIAGGTAIVVMVILTLIAGGFGWVTADFRGAKDAREQTIADGSYRIAAYEKFYDLCGDIKAIEQQIVNQEAMSAGLPKDQVAVNKLALNNQRASLIQEYNADARKADTKANFLASDLPYSIDPNQETTTC